MFRDEIGAELEVTFQALSGLLVAGADVETDREIDSGS